MRADGGQPLRVVQLIDSLTPGEASSSVVATLDMRRFGIEVAVLAGNDGQPQRAAVSERRLFQRKLAIVPRLRASPSVGGDAFAFLWLVQWLRVVRPDVVHTHGPRFSSLGRLAASAAAIPIVHSAHEWGRNPIERRLARRTSALVVATVAKMREGIDRGIGEPDQYRTVPVGVPMADDAPTAADRRRARRRFGFGDRFVVGIEAPFTDRNDHEAAIRAVARLARPDVQLVMVGAGATRPAMQRLVGELGLRRSVHFEPGSRRQLSECFDLSLVVDRVDGLTVGAKRAASLGQPIVAIDSGRVADLVHDGSTGTLVASDDDGGLVAALRSAIDDAARVDTMGRNAFEAAREFSVDRMRGDVAAIWFEAARP